MENELFFNGNIENGSLKIVIVTGSTGAIGKAIARQIAVKEGYMVIMVARDKAKATQAVREVRNESGNQNVYYLLADLSSKKEIRNLANSISLPLDVLVNNAACTPVVREETTGGIEKQWATNVLGYFWIMDAFTQHLKKAAPSRIVNVASYYAGGLDLGDPEFRMRNYENNSAYRQSKQADRMLSVAFAEKFKPFGIAVNACHPGEVNSRLSNDLGFGGHESPDKGAATPVWLATTPVGLESTGKYFEYLMERTCMFSRDARAVKQLYDLCASYV